MSLAADDFPRAGRVVREESPARRPHRQPRMRLSFRVLFGVALVAGCASTPPRVAQPVVLDFQWDPPFTEKTTGFGRPKTLERREELLAIAVRNLFDTRFQEVVLDNDPDAPARVALKVSELPRSTVVANRPVPADMVVPGAVQRCGTVEYSVFVDGRELTRESVALDCDQYGSPDYDRAVLRAADAAARLLGAV
jgi:hypothetical protein